MRDSFGQWYLNPKSLNPKPTTIVVYRASGQYTGSALNSFLSREEAATPAASSSPSKLPCEREAPTACSGKPGTALKGRGSSNSALSHAMHRNTAARIFGRPPTNARLPAGPHHSPTKESSAWELGCRTPSSSTTSSQGPDSTYYSICRCCLNILWAVFNYNHTTTYFEHKDNEMHDAAASDDISDDQHEVFDNDDRDDAFDNGDTLHEPGPARTAVRVGLHTFWGR